MTIGCIYPTATDTSSHDVLALMALRERKRVSPRASRHTSCSPEGSLDPTSPLFGERWTCHALGPLDELKLGGDVDCALEAACDRAEPSVERVHPLGFLSAFLGDREPVAHVDAFDE